MDGRSTLEALGAPRQKSSRSTLLWRLPSRMNAPHERLSCIPSESAYDRAATMD